MVLTAYRRKRRFNLTREPKGQVITAASPEEDIPPTYNLMEALKRSVQKEGQARKKPAPPPQKGKPEKKKKTG